MFVTMLLFTATTAFAADETLTISGDGINKTITYSRSDLEALKTIMAQHTYSLANNFPTEKTEYAAGIPLLYLLQQAEIKEAAQLIAFTASDGYKRIFTIEELLYTPRYYFPSTGEKQPVPVMVCLRNSADNFKSLEPMEFKLILGQRSIGEQTNPWLVKNLSLIEVSCEKPEKWAQVTFNRVSGPQGVTLQLLHENIDSVKIYYTTDGSNPTVESKMYNISASYYQPQLNQPLVIDKTTVVKAVAIGAGREDSQLASLTVSFGEAMFSDLADYEWAKPAIETLADKGIIAGMGNNRFEPSASLSRAMFVTMLGRAINDTGNAYVNGKKDSFSDIDFNSWYGPYIQWAVDKNIVSGYPDGLFMPHKALTLEEMIVMAVRAGKTSSASLAENGISALSISGISTWALPYISFALNNNMLANEHLLQKNTNGYQIEGKKAASRAEAAFVLNQLLLLIKPQHSAFGVGE